MRIAVPQEDVFIPNGFGYIIKIAELMELMVDLNKFGIK